MLAVLLAAVVSISVSAQITTSDVAGRVTDKQGQPLAGVSVEAVHVPSGTVYTAVTNSTGRYTLSGMRVGGPYTVKAVHAGFNEQTTDNLSLSLGNTATVNFTLTSAIDVSVTVESEDNQIINESRTGASTTVSAAVISTLPTTTGRINDFTRLSPLSGAGGTFAGQDNRFNNITVDGSYFNNSFGLGGQPGDRTGVAPISLNAIEAIQVNVAPYDVRQGNFVGAGVNTVTKSGTNTYHGSVYYQFRKPSLVGKEAGTNTYDPGDFNFRNYGFSLGGPLPFFNFGENNGPAFVSGKNKLFFFFNYENDALTEVATPWVARNAGEPIEGNVTRVLKSDLDGLSNYLKTNFNYETGPYQGYPSLTPAKRYLFRTDYNINSTNRLSLRYSRLDSSTDVLESNSSSLGFGNRRTNKNSLNFQNANYSILENIRSMVGEWNSAIGASMSNSLIVGYTKQDESRGYKGTLFPLVDILEQGSTYTSFGFEPFTPNNELRYNSFQVQDNLNFYHGSHTFAAGVSFENYKSENVFFPGSQSVYVYNSLADFYTDANGYLANPGRTTSPVNLRRFQVRYSNIPGLDKPLQPLKVNYVGLYGQDTWKIKDNFTLTYGLRFDVPFFAETGFTNPQANALTFKDENGQAVQYETQKLPDPNILWSPRVGFNWNPMHNGRLQVRGGTGIFTGKPAYVWISNQIGGNGILTGFDQFDNTVVRPFDPNPNRYKPSTVTGAPASSYELALTEPNFKFPQIWRSSIAADLKIPFGFVAGAEFLYSRDVNGIYYINANLSSPNTSFSGPDNRPRWTVSNRLNSNITSAVVLQNQNVGKTWNMAFSLERPFANGLFVKAAYSYGESKNTVDPGSIAFGSWNNNQHAGDPNNPGLGFSAASPGSRVFATFSYHKEYFRFGATTVSMFWQTFNGGNISYSFSGDLNGDGGTSNDLIYIPKDTSEMNFEQFTASGTTFTVAQQTAAWDAFINQDPYLSKHRGQYAERGAAFLPFSSNLDFSIAQDIIARIGKTKHNFQVRADILNFGNLLNHNWGVGKAFNSTQPLIARGADSSGKALYRLRNFGSSLISGSYIATAGVSDVYRIRIGLRYSF